MNPLLRQCEATNNNGLRCKKTARRNSPFCIFHDPTFLAKRRLPKPKEPKLKQEPIAPKFDFKSYWDVRAKTKLVWKPDAMPDEPDRVGPFTIWLRSNADIALVQGGKGDLALSEPLATPTGWTTVGNLEIGDRLFDETGTPCIVLAKSEVLFHDAYKVIFSDGSIIRAGGDHEWQVERWMSQPKKSDSRTTKRVSLKVRTRDMVAECGYRYTSQNTFTYSIRNTLPLNLPSIPKNLLPLDPYLLGLWLGDPKRTEPLVRANEEDMEYYENYLREIGLSFRRTSLKNHAPRTYIHGIRNDLIKSGLCRCKSIPDLYLRASGPQRLALLQGLMDTGGDVEDEEKRQAEFYSSKPLLLHGVQELIISLGMNLVESIPLRKSPFPASSKGAYRLRFTPTMPVFRLERKLAKFKAASQNEEPMRRGIVDVVSDGYAFTQCITVSSPSHLYLAGQAMIPTRNSGKSDALIAHNLRPEYINSSRFLGVIFRREYKRLTELIDRTKEWLSRTPIRWQWQGDMSRVVFESGARLAFHNVEHEEDVRKYQGWEIASLCIDQLDEFLESSFNFLLLQNRSGDPKIKAVCRANANPGGIGHVWLKKRFIDGFEPGKKYTIETVIDGVTYKQTYLNVFATVFDNPRYRNDKAYIAKLATEKNPVLRKALFEGDWNIVTGQFFTEFATLVHVIPSRGLPHEWKRLGGMDYGNYKVLEILCEDHIGNIYVEYECAYEPGTWGQRLMTATEYGDMSAKFMIDRKICGGARSGKTEDYILMPRVIGDTNMWSATGRDVGSKRTAVEIIQDIWNEKFKRVELIAPRIVPVSKRRTEEYQYRIACWDAIRDYLHYEYDEAGENLSLEPRLLFMDRCRGIIETLPSLQGNPNDPRDIADKQIDHYADALKMPLMEIRRPVPRPLMKEIKTLDDDMQKFFYELHTRGMNHKLWTSV